MDVFNRKETKFNRNNLRKNQTDAEKALWSRLRNKQLNGLKFFRQYGINRYITDFYCPKIKLAIEIDGGGHYTDEGMNYDTIQTEIFNTLGIKTIRFSNTEVSAQLDNILEEILKLTPPSPL